MGFADFIASHMAELKEQFLEHLWLTLISVTLAVVIGLFLGILISKKTKLAGVVMGAVNGVQTIPSLALLGVLLPVFGIGVVPAIAALFLYALLPIVRNTYTGIRGIDPAVREAATGMGLTEYELLKRVELPLALPVIFAGIRTAFVINVGIATLCALIAAGGLGEFIFRGLATNNPQMILAGALPASALALGFDALLGYLERHLRTLIKPALIIYAILMILLGAWYSGMFQKGTSGISAGFPSEFIERGDGYRGLAQTYELDFEVNELSIGLMYDALKNGEVELISGFSTDGRVIAYDLIILEDDMGYFPPYHAAPLMTEKVMQQFPGAKEALDRLENVISDEEMARMNFEVDEKHRPVIEVATEYLRSGGFKTDVVLNGSGEIHIGSKDFTESYLLAEIFRVMIENYAGYDVEVHPGFGGTKLLFDAARTGEIDIYPEYTGTGLLVILPDEVVESFGAEYTKEEVYRKVSEEFRKRYSMTWGMPLGFNNTHALMMRREYAQERGIRKISDLSRFSGKDHSQ